MNIQLFPLREEETIAFKEEMQEAFHHGFQAYYKEDETNQWQVLPDEDFYQSLNAVGAEAYEAFSEDGQRVGGAIITANGNMGELAFLYVEVGVQSKGIGQAICRISTAVTFTSTSTAANSMPLSFSTSIIQTRTCLSSLIRKTGCSSLKRE